SSSGSSTSTSTSTSSGGSTSTSTSASSSTGGMHTCTTGTHNCLGDAGQIGDSGNRSVGLKVTSMNAQAISDVSQQADAQASLSQIVFTPNATDASAGVDAKVTAVAAGNGFALAMPSHGTLSNDSKTISNIPTGETTPCSYMLTNTDGSVWNITMT